MERILSLLRSLGTLLGLFSVVAIVIAVLCFLAAALIYSLLPELHSSVGTLLAVGALFLLLFVVGTFNQLKVALLGRRGRYGTNTAVMIVAFVLIAVLVNFVGFRNHRRFDITAAGQFTLSRQTLKILDELKQPVKATGFFVPGDVYKDVVDDLLAEYAYHSDKFTYDFVDPDANPTIAYQYEIGEYEYGTTVFESGERRQHVPSDLINEQDFTAAILQVTGTKQKKVYFLTGHNERDIADLADEGYGYAKIGLEGDNYQVETLNLAVTPEVPEDCAVLVVAGPQKPLAEQELESIEEYFEGGGNGLILVDTNPTPELQSILAKWAIALGEGAVIDKASFVNPDIGTPFAQLNPYVSITGLLSGTFFPECTSVSSTLTEEQVEEGTVAIAPLAWTSEDSWLETELSPDETPEFDEDKDVIGPLALAVMLEASAPLGQEPKSEGDTTRLVIFGDSDFASNRFFYSWANGDLFLNSTNWLAEQEELISIRPKPLLSSILVVSQRVWRWIYLSSIGLLPLAVALMGGISWWRRR